MTSSDCVCWFTVVRLFFKLSITSSKFELNTAIDTRWNILKFCHSVNLIGYLVTIVSGNGLSSVHYQANILNNSYLMSFKSINFKVRRFYWRRVIQKCRVRNVAYFVQGTIHKTGTILCMDPANEGRRYIVTLSLIGSVHTYNDPCKT